MFERIYPLVWLAQSRGVREQLALDLKLPKTGLTEVRDQELISDGYSVYDLQNITVDALIGYVGKKKSFQELWEASVEKAQEKIGEKAPKPKAPEEKKEEAKVTEPKAPEEKKEEAKVTEPVVKKNNSKDPNKIDLAEEF